MSSAEAEEVINNLDDIDNNVKLLVASVREFGQPGGKV